MGTTSDFQLPSTKSTSLDMATTIDAAFDQLHGWMTPTGTETTQAKNHRASIASCLRDSFGLDAFFQSGSFGNGTSVSGYSDVDYLAAIPGARVPFSSAQFLTQVHRVLDARFARTNVHIASPVIVLPFGTAREETTEVVPAEFVRTSPSGHRIYQIANGGGGWMKSSPEAHGAYVDAVNTKHSRRAKPLIRFVKGWKYYAKVPVSSFYLEMFVAQYANAESSILYPIDLLRIFNSLQGCGLATMVDPAGISESISACPSLPDRFTATARLADAVKWATLAVDAAKQDRVRDAFGYWNKVFDGGFPAYG